MIALLIAAAACSGDCRAQELFQTMERKLLSAQPALQLEVTSHAEGWSEAPAGNGPGGSGTTAALGPSTPVRATRPMATAVAAIASRPRRVPWERGALGAGWVTFRWGILSATRLRNFSGTS